MIPDAVIRPILTRLAALERATIRVRKGEVTATNPLSVKLGGASTAYSNVRTLDSTTYVVGDFVSVLTFGNDMLVLGRIADGSAHKGSTTITWPGGSAYSNVTLFDHGLGRTPTVALATPLLSPGDFAVEAYVTSLSSTQIGLRCRASDGTTPASTASRTLYWSVA